MVKIPHKDDSTKGGQKRTYWTRDMANQGRRVLRKQLESELAAKGQKWTQADKVKALNERWGEYCETQRSIGEGQAMLREHPGIDRQERDFPHRKR